MKITALTVGTRGDVQPLIALGAALGDRGHEVRLATHAAFEDQVRSRGLGFAPLAVGKVGQGVATKEGRKWAEQAGRTPAVFGFLRDARSVAAQRLGDAAAACEDAEVVLASNLTQLIGWQLAERRDVPLVRILFHAPNYWMARSPTRPLVRLGRGLTWTAARPWLNRVRREALGADVAALPATPPLMADDRRAVLDLLPYSPSVFPPPDRQRDEAVVTGAWHLEGTIDVEPPAGLEAFLDAGSPPVYVGFGTQPDTDPVATARLAVDAVRAAGRRCLISVRPEVLESLGDLGPDALAIGGVDHAWLFPRCAAVAHHCGAGTIAAALRAGVPTIAVPHFSDQFSWATLLHERGAATEPIPKRKLTRESLRAAAHEAATSDPIRRTATELSGRVATEDGIAVAVDAFERRVANRQSMPRPEVAA